MKPNTKLPGIKKVGGEPQVKVIQGEPKPKKGTPVATPAPSQN